MPATIIHRPGMRHGPCAISTCGHAECEAMRMAAEASCSVCRREIGYNRPYYSLTGSDRIHADCYAERAAAEPNPDLRPGDPSELGHSPVLSRDQMDNLDTLPYPIRHELELIHRFALRIGELTEQLTQNLAEVERARRRP